MGLYTSWASLALTNHVLVRLAARRVGISKFTDYLVLGDDVVIARDAVAHEYLVLLSGLGVEVSTTKSIRPSEKIGAEFASKLLCRDGNVGPLPFGLLIDRPRLLSRFEFAYQVVNRWINSGSLNESPSLSDILDARFGNPNQVNRYRLKCA